MNKSKILKGILFSLGLFLIVIGLGRLFMPVEFFSFVGVELGGSISSLSEARGMGGFMFSCGVLIMLGAFIPTLTFTSTIISCVFFLSFGFARLLGIAIDGPPSPETVQGIVFEFVFGLAALAAFLKYRKK